jgi:hypothetical protein
MYRIRKYRYNIINITKIIIDIHMRLHLIYHFLVEKIASVKTFFKNYQNRFFWGFKSI